MANIKQQKKRVRIAARQRLENLRYRSTIKTLTKRLERAASGDGDPAAEHRELVRLIDRAAARGALHKNTAARKKAQAARIAAGQLELAQAALAARDVDQGSLELEVAGEPRAALERVVELGQAHRGVAQLVVGERLRLADELPDVVRVALQARGDLLGSEPLGEQALALLNPPEVAGERAHEAR